MQELVAAPAVRDLPRRRLHRERGLDADVHSPLQLLAHRPVVPARKYDGVLEPRHEVVRERLVRIAPHRVLVKPPHLVGDVPLDERPVSAHPGRQPRLLAGAPEDAPVVRTLGVADIGLHAIAPPRVDVRQIAPPSVRRLFREYLRLFEVQDGGHKLLDGELVALFLHKPLLRVAAADVHHPAEPSRPFAVASGGDERGDVRRQARKAVLMHPVPVRVVDVILDMTVGIGRYRSLNEIEVFIPRHSEVAHVGRAVRRKRREERSRSDKRRHIDHHVPVCRLFHLENLLSTNEYSAGVKQMPKTVAASIPEQVQTPMPRIAPAPAPRAKTSGRTPMMKLHAVIITAL